MERNGQDASGVIMIPADPTQAETAIQTARDAVRQPFAAMEREHEKYYHGDMAELDALEKKTLGEIAVILQETLPQYRQAKVQAAVETALKGMDPYENNRVARLEAEVGRLKAQTPQRPKVSEIEQLRQTNLQLYCLQQLQGSPLPIDRNTVVQADLKDPAHYSMLFEVALSDGQLPVVDALLNDPLGRHLRYLTPEQRARGEGLLGLEASPALKAKIEAYETMIVRYKSRMAAMKRRFREQGWQPVDSIAAMARGEQVSSEGEAH